MTPYEMVRQFHDYFGVDVDKEFSYESVHLRRDLMTEELVEIEDEFYRLELGLPINKTKLTKELADLMYVTIGTAVTFGLPLEEVFTEVHKSNMSKLGDDGKPVRRADGKILKGENYKEPELDKYFDS